MYNDTNIDDLLNEEKNNDFNNNIINDKINNDKSNNNKEPNKNTKWFLLGGIGIILVIGIVIFFANNKIELEGEEEITIYQNSTYIDPGYKVYNLKNEEVDKEVSISELDTSIIGDYKVTYKLYGIIKKTRIVHVIEKPIGATYIHLKGDDIIYLSIGEEYQESGCVVIDTVDSNLTNKVVINDNIDSSKAGIYEVTYMVTNSSGVTTSATRKVIVMGSEITLSLDNTNYTNQDVNIKVHINDNYFSYMVLPNGEKITNKDYSYKVSINGTYKFIIYNNKGTIKEDSITVSNIDKEKPTGTCSGYIQDGKSYITVSANDNVGISKYVSNDVNGTNGVITLNSEVSSPSVIIYDKAGNSTSISCTLEKKSSSSSSSSDSSKSSSNSSSSSSSSAKKVNLTVASWNIGRGAKHGVTAGSKYGEKLAEYNIDIVGLQEAKPYNSDKQGSFSSFISKISKTGNFGNYTYVATPAGNAVVSKYSFVSKETFDLSKCYETRKLMKTVINVNGIDISFYNTHTDYKTCRTNQYADIFKIMDSDSNPTILVGDLNDPAFDEVLKANYSSDYVIYGHSGYKNDTDYVDVIIVNGKGKISYVSDQYVYTKDKLTDHNLVIATMAIG